MNLAGVLVGGWQSFFFFFFFFVLKALFSIPRLACQNKIASDDREVGQRAACELNFSRVKLL